ncbi:restriction endonuclease subunit S, partial [Frankia sp. Mgl5]
LDSLKIPAAGYSRHFKFLKERLILRLPLPEQQSVVKILDRAADLRAKRLRALALLDTLSQEIFYDIFGDPVRNTKEWPLVKIRDLVHRIDSGRSPKCLNRPAHNGEWGILKLSAVTGCEYKAVENKALPSSEIPFPECEVKSGDLLFTRKNTRELVGACAIVEETPPQLLMPDLIFRLVPDTEAPVDPIYLHSLLSYPSKRRVVQNLASGSASSMPNISKSRLQSLEVELPPLDLQKQFAEKIRAITSLRRVYRAELSKFDSLFESLQHRAFRSEL